MTLTVLDLVVFLILFGLAWFTVAAYYLEHQAHTDQAHRDRWFPRPDYREAERVRDAHDPR